MRQVRSCFIFCCLKEDSKQIATINVKKISAEQKMTKERNVQAIFIFTNQSL